MISEFKKASREVRKDPSKAYVWQPIISQYPPAFLGQCANAILWSNQFVRTQLRTVMFHGQTDADEKAKIVVRKLSSFARNKTHNRHIHFDELCEIGLDVELVEQDQDLQDLVLTVHHCFMHTLMNTTGYKIIENQFGAALVKKQQAVVVK